MYDGPMPSRTEEMEGFFEAAQRGEFALHRCRGCGTWYWPASGCRNCANEPFLANMEWQPASGKGTVFSFAIMRRTFHPAFPAPFIYALVETQEGPLIPAGIDVSPEDVRVGLPLEAHFVRLSDEFTVPRFRPA